MTFNTVALFTALVGIITVVFAIAHHKLHTKGSTAIITVLVTIMAIGIILMIYIAYKR